MESNIFSAGTVPGSPTSENEIKTLICYLLSELNKTVSFFQLHESFLDNKLVNYFELIGALSELEETGHVTKLAKQDIFYFSITDLGRKTAETLGSALPFTVKTRALESAKKAIARNIRLSETKVEIVAVKTGGYRIIMSLPEDDYDLVSFTVFAPIKEEAEKIRVNFLNHPTYIYGSVMALLTGEEGLIEGKKDETNPLF